MKSGGAGVGEGGSGVVGRRKRRRRNSVTQECIFVVDLGQCTTGMY